VDSLVGSRLVTRTAARASQQNYLGEDAKKEAEAEGARAGAKAAEERQKANQ